MSNATRNEVSFQLVDAPDELVDFEFVEVEGELDQNDIDEIDLIENRVAIEFGSAIQPVAELSVTIGVPALSALMGAWLQAHYGRKVRIKVRDIEVEASSMEEVEELLEKAAALLDKENRDQ